MNESLIKIEIGSSKHERYAALVSARKQCGRCSDVVNPSTYDDGRFDLHGHIGAWSDWQGNLDAEVLVVGQEWGGTDNYGRQLGRDMDGDPTNQNLVTLMDSVGVTLPRPSTLQGSPSNGTFFFTNGVLCLRKGAATNTNGKGNNISERSFSNCARTFLRAQIELIEPRFVLVLGKLPWNGLMEAFSLPIRSTLKETVENGPVRLNLKTIAFPLFHCGSKSNINRPLQIQKIDWQKMKTAMVNLAR